jgi:hypothetical protein
MTMIKKLITLGIGTLILSIIGLYNGYPLVYSDTGTYIYSGFDKFIPVDRPITYGLFLRFFSFNYSAWFVIIVQNLLTAFVIYEVLKMFFANSKHFHTIYYLILSILVFTTGIGWYSNQLMPDFFAPLMILVFYTLLKGKDLSIYTKVILCLILIYTLISHFSHLLIGTTLVIVAITLKILLKQRLQEISFGRLYFLTAIVFSSWFILPGINYLAEKKFILSKGSHVFLMAHLNESGILEKFLKENCSKSEFKDCKLCHYKDSLPTGLASFIWSSNDIVQNTGGWENSKEEYNKIISETLKRPKYLLLNIYRSITYGFIQLTKNEIGQGLSAYNEGSPPYGQIHWRFHDELNNYLNSRQNIWNGVTLKLDILNNVHLLLIIFSLLIVIIIFTSSIRLKIDPNTMEFLVFVIISIIVNSFFTAGLNSPCERFQARVVWLLPLSIMILILKNNELIIRTIYNMWYKKLPAK